MRINKGLKCWRFFGGEVQVKRGYSSDRVESLGGCVKEVKMFIFNVMRVTFDYGNEQLEKCVGKGNQR